jgi:hypothetical protein
LFCFVVVCVEMCYIIYIVGEVLNTTNNNISFAKVVATLYDKDNVVIGTSSAYTEPSTILPLDNASFKIMIGSIDVSNIVSIRKYQVRASTT